MYLSRLILNPRDRRVWRDLSDIQLLHRRILSAFPKAVAPRTAREEFAILYRLEVPPIAPVTQVLVQSEVVPDWMVLPSGYLENGVLAENPMVKDISRILMTIREGQVFHFRLLANVTRKIDTKSAPDGSKKNGRRVPLRREADQYKWLERKGIECGFSLMRTEELTVPDVRAIRWPLLGRGSKRSGQAVTIEGILFEGRLRVDDPSRFIAAIKRGIGPAKAYGYGMLSLAPG
jgi:CRISPR system Cascade subunit CasE